MNVCRYHYVAYGLRHILVAEYVGSNPTAEGDEWVRCYALGGSVQLPPLFEPSHPVLHK